MSMKVVFDAEEIAPKSLREAIEGVRGDSEVEITFHQHREPKAKVAKS
jgi:hypothetical protein